MRVPVEVAPSAAGSVVALYREHHAGLVRLAVMLVGDQATAEDVVQDVFLRLHRGLPRLRDDGNLLAYTRAAVLNASRTALRRRKLAFRLIQPYEPPAWSAEAAALVSEERRGVLQALHRLPARRREALILRYYLDLDDAEIGLIMGVRPGTVRSTLSRALKALERELQAARERENDPEAAR